MYLATICDNGTHIRGVTNCHVIWCASLLYSLFVLWNQAGGNQVFVAQASFVQTVTISGVCHFQTVPILQQERSIGAEKCAKL